MLGVREKQRAENKPGKIFKRERVEGRRGGGGGGSEGGGGRGGGGEGGG